MSNSGSSANLLAIAALIYSGRLAQNDEVIVPAVSWSTTYFPLSQYNLKLKFVDINKDTLNIDIESLESAISKNTKAIFAVNLLGNPNDYEKIIKIAKKHDLILIEDNCEALGGRYNNKALGTFGLLGTYSTFYSHHICTMEGGITVTNDEELYHYLLSIRAHGWTRNLPNDSKLYKKSDDEFYESFNFIMPGYNLRPLEMEAAIGIEQLKKLDRIIEQRISNAKYFIQKMKEIQDIRIQKEIGSSSWFGFAMILENKNINKRNQVVKELKKNNIEVRPIVAGNFTKNQAIKYMNYSIHGELLNANDIHENGFFVGNHSKENKDKIDYMIEILKKGLE
jgi:CDP-6-deoxy-D-xylo-4-hexulose-3-dehydrase